MQIVLIIRIWRWIFSSIKNNGLWTFTFSVCVAALQVFGDEKLLWLVKAHVWPSPLGPWSFDIWNYKIKNIIYFVWKCKIK